MLIIDSRDGGRLAADVVNPGATPTLLLLPCGAELRGVWQPVIAALAEGLRRDWRIVAADHRGHGDSSRSDSYRFVQFLGDLHRWIEYLQARPLIIAGGSIGGALGMVAAGESANIDGLVMLDVPTVPTLERVLDERVRVRNAHDNAHPAMRTIDPNFIASGFIEDVFTDLDRWRRAALALRLPVLLVTAKRGVIGEAQRAEFRSHIPHAEFAELDTTHLVARDDPQGVAGLISAFMARHFDPVAPRP